MFQFGDLLVLLLRHKNQLNNIKKILTVSYVPERQKSILQADMNTNRIESEFIIQTFLCLCKQ